jgi:uncharacterized protein YfiM (DUF2279 family)
MVMVAFLYVVSLCSIILFIAYAGIIEGDKFTIAKDSFLAKDKIVHLLGGVLLGYTLDRSRAMDLNVLWEMKDGFANYQKYGAIGGDGFSWKDLAVTRAGIEIGIMLKHTI